MGNALSFCGSSSQLNILLKQDESRGAFRALMGLSGLGNKTIWKLISGITVEIITGHNVSTLALLAIKSSSIV